MTLWQQALSKPGILTCPDCGRRNRVAARRQGASCGACGAALPSTRALRVTLPAIRALRVTPCLVGALTGVYALGLLAAWWLTTCVGEASVPAILLLYLPRVLYLLPLLLLAPLAMRFGRRALPAQAACLMLVIGPVMGLQLPGRGEKPARGAMPVRVLSFNVGLGESSALALMSAVARARPTVVVAQESGDLSSLFPGWNTHYKGEYFLATRLPILAAETRPYLTARPWRAGARYRLKGPRGAFTLYSLHLDTPRRSLEDLTSSLRPGGITKVGEAIREIRADAVRRSLEARAARAWIGESTGPCIVAGDFNAPPDSPLHRSLWTGLRDAFAIAGIGYGYTAHAPRPWVRIDRILATPDWKVSRAYTEVGSGKDHLPVVAELWR